MAWEIELKAVLASPKEVEAFLTQQGFSATPLEKEDIYYQGPTPLRLRREGSRWTVTSKAKTVIDGLEVNRELEFEISSAENFFGWIQLLGFSFWYKKNKRGRAYHWNDLLIEVVHVEPLGWFVEIEKILPEEADITAQQNARQEILTVLNQLQVPLENLESRTYAELLGVRVHGKPVSD
ncbi:MAG: class IV adenylate cyclase [Spirochaetales bacterium]|nr:class IV adenylate cyclase [Spirochaetales bacterium]